MNNPQCIHLGKNVGIGTNSFFLPVTFDNGIQYEPSNIIGDGTWIGKGSSIAAINRVDIGKNVLKGYRKFERVNIGDSRNKT